MKINKINNLITNLNQSVLSEGQNMTSPAIYDDFMKDIVVRIKNYDIDTLTETLMTLVKTGQLKQIKGNFYKYKDFHILELFKKDGIDYSDKLKLIDKLNLNIAQKYIETVENRNNIYIITKIPGTETSDLKPLWKIGAQNLSKEDRLAAFQDLQKLTKAGFTDDSITNSNRLWYVNDENKIIIPVFEYLRPINSDELPKDIIEKYYNILFT